MAVDRRRMLLSLAAGTAGVAIAPLRELLGDAAPSRPERRPALPLRAANGAVDWQAVRDLFPLAKDRVHLASFLLVSHPKPVAEAIERFRARIDADPLWLEAAAFEGEDDWPFRAVKSALADYVGGEPAEICLTANTTTALAMAYHGLRIRADQEVLTTEHDPYSHHESIRYAAARSGAGVRYVALYERGAGADAVEIVEQLARAIGPKTRAVGVTWVHSSTGVKIPIEPIAEAVARANRGRADADRCLLIVDGVHGFGNQDVDAARLGADFFATGTHKWLFAPRGTGFLWGRTDAWPHLRPTIPSFDPDQDATWKAWMERRELPATAASFLSPGGFLAYEHLLAIPAAVELHRAIGRDNIAARVANLNAMFRDGAANIPRVTLHTPRDPSLSGGLTAFEVEGLTARQVKAALAAKDFRTSESPYKVSYARVCAGIMNFPEEVRGVLDAIRAL